jgi:hypothetical protein
MRRRSCQREFLITEEANLNPATGGLVVYDKEAPAS